jgi:hypothetical protein
MMRFMDSADTYNTDVGGNAKWTTFNATSVPNGRNGRGIQLGENLSRTIDYQDEWYVGFAIILNEGVGFANTSIYACLSNGTTLATLRTQSDGTLALYAGNTLNLIGYSPSLQALHLNTWYYIEINVSFAGGMGNITASGSVRVNGVVLIMPKSESTGVMGSSLIINDSKANQHLFLPSNIDGTTVIDDVYIADTNGGSVTTFAGDIAIGTLFPRQDVTTQWSATGTPQYQQINGQYAEDQPTTNIYSNTSGQYDNFDWQPVNPFTGAIVAVQYGIYMNKDGEGSRTVAQTVGNTGSIELTGPNISPSDSFVYFLLCMDTDPATSAQWTQGGFNGTQFGVQLVA